MRAFRFVLFFAAVLPCNLLHAQTTTSVARDPQAITVLSQVLVSAGGTTAISAITDYTASGTITYTHSPNVQENVTISGRGPAELRIDTPSSAGARSYLINGPQNSTQPATGKVDVRNIEAPMMAGNVAAPYRELAAVFGNSQFSLSYVGLVQSNGHSLHDIRAQRALPGPLRTYHTVDFFIDSATLQLAITQDTLPQDATPRTIRYSDFRSVGGVLVPFSIDEEIGGEPFAAIQLNQVMFNNGLPDSTFQLPPQ
jgi:hypothetical protein